ncbi:unnamed protein product [Brachionus calyciflorus]|uniref:Uncharacterized protein n=1 Tax=Brachionus calyciflorus TaxID=104777 RepID=A0A814F916_9BILA|nr:unnamed protein product [Brachionus calyciflorus]
MSSKNCEYCNIFKEELYLITLPCGYIVCYEHVNKSSNSIDCFMCKEHKIDLNSCLNMKKNRDKINEINRISKFKDLKLELEKINVVKSDPKYFIDECNLINKIDLKREQIKLEFDKNIDKSFQNLINQAKRLREEYENSLEKKLKDFNINELNENLDSAQIDKIEKIKIIPMVNYLDQIKKINFLNSNYKFPFYGNNLGEIVGIIHTTKLSNELSKIKKTSRSCCFSSNFISELPTGQITGASILDPKTLAIWNYESNSISKIKGESNIVYSTVTSSGYIVCFYEDFSVKVWLSGNIIKNFKLINFSSYFSIKCDHSFLIFYDTLFLIRIFNFLTGDLVQFGAHRSPLLSSLLLSEKEYLTSHADLIVNLWELKNSKCLRTIEFKSKIICMDKLNDKEIVLGTDSGEIIGLYINSFKKTQFVKAGEHKIDFIHFVEENLFICSIGNQLKLWENSNGAFRIVSKKKFPNLKDVLILRNGELLILEQNNQATIWA